MFVRLARPLTTLTKKETQFLWSEMCEESFQELHNKLTSTLEFALPEAEVEYDLYTDASHSSLE